MKHSASQCVALLSLCLMGVVRAMGQQPSANQPISFDDLPPAVKLGVRVEQVRRQVPVLSEVVIVPGPAEAVDAIAGWSLGARYPVLIDDGSSDARELIGLFVRAYKPERVLRLADMKARSLAADDRKTAAAYALLGAWRNPGVDQTGSSIGKLWQDVGFKPVGVVVTSIDSPAWASAVALAAGHGQLLVWADLPTNHNQPLTNEQVLQISKQVDAGIVQAIDEDAALAEMNLVWRGAGDDLDGLTFCGGIGSKLLHSENNYLATTDVLTRTLVEENGTFIPGERWAWGGQIFGTPARSMYDAMCALFLQPERAWLFDTYPTGMPWGQYNLTSASHQFADAKIEVEVHRPPETDLAGLARMGAIDAGVVFVTSKGPSWNFDLHGSRAPAGRARPGDWPMLKKPVAAYMVHSFSCENPGIRSTVAGRLLARGAYAFFGSVQEPTLAAFLPSELIAKRWLAPAPMGAAMRFDDGAASKLAMIGDPLITFGPPAQRLPGTLVNSSNPAGEQQLVQVQDALAEQLKSGDLAGGFRTLVMLGRDDDAAKLAAATLRDKPEWMTPAAAEIALFVGARAGDAAVVKECFLRLDSRMKDQMLCRDALWLTVGAELVATGRATQEVEDLLRTYMREDMVDRDGAAIVRAIRETQGKSAAQNYASTFRETLPSEGYKTRFDLEMRDALRE
ncbi:MAG: hypothetical protein H6815_05195 [Phycisphaeraceae bacterium]|nr:hypothetical protein [Phycisphaerales bacterium]MCB9859832.1 hypothetical protein [Phycisphaeraceae bacterium]